MYRWRTSNLNSNRVIPFSFSFLTATRQLSRKGFYESTASRSSANGSPNLKRKASSCAAESDKGARPSGRFNVIIRPVPECSKTRLTKSFLFGVRRSMSGVPSFLQSKHPHSVQHRLDARHLMRTEYIRL